MDKSIRAFTSGHRQKSDLLHSSYNVVKFLVVIMSVTILVPGVCAIGTDEMDRNLTGLDRLRLNLFTNYDKEKQPLVNEENTNITMGLTVNYIDIAEMEGKVTLHCWVSLRWMDENRSWKPLEYDNITQIQLQSSNVWHPEIKLFNSAGQSGDYMGDTQVILSSEGSFLWVPPAVYTAYCNLNMLKWPFDTQTCKLKIGSWTISTINPTYNELKQSIEYGELAQSTEWEITSGKAEYVRKDYANYLEYTFILKRQSTMYTALIYLPASCIVLMTLSVFWLPPQMGEKILLNGVLIVIIAAYLMYFAQLLPVLAQNTPLVVLFYSAALLLLSFSTIIAVTVLYLSTAKHKRRLPEFLKQMLNGKLGTILLLSNFTTEAEPQSMLHNGSIKELEEHVYDNAVDEPVDDPLGINPTAGPSGRALQFEWVLLATAVDRICFVCFSIVFAVLAFVYSV